jgi:hypothetical protein
VADAPDLAGLVAECEAEAFVRAHRHDERAATLEAVAAVLAAELDRADPDAEPHLLLALGATIMRLRRAAIAVLRKRDEALSEAGLGPECGPLLGASVAE